MFDKNTPFGRIANNLLYVIVTIAVLIVPTIYGDSYNLFQFSMVAVYAMLLMGLNILTGFTGQISLGHGAFYAFGAYFSAAIAPQLGDYFFMIFPMVAIAGLVVGFLFALPAIRFEGIYLAIVTISLAVTTPSLIKYFDRFTGGVTGVNIDRPEVPSWLPVDKDQYVFLIAACLALILFYAMRNLIKSRIGRSLTAIRDNEIVAQTMGISHTHYKLSAFAVSVMYASIAGAMAGYVIQYISAEVFALELSIFLIVGLVIGGVASKWGPIFGALYLLYLPNLAEEIAKGAPIFVSGIIIILLVVFTPGGTNEIVMRSYYRIKRDFWF